MYQLIFIVFQSRVNLEKTNLIKLGTLSKNRDSYEYNVFIH